MGKPLFKPEQFIAAIANTGGIITIIAKNVGCDWHTAKKYIMAHPNVKRAYDAECEGILDLAESKLINLMQNSDFPAIKFYLMTKGKNRGYVERQEVSNFNIEVSELTDEQLERIANGEDPLQVARTTKSGG